MRTAGPRVLKSMSFVVAAIPIVAFVTGCSAEIGDHYRDIADYDTVKSRFPASVVKHFPNNAPEGSRMYAYFVPMQGGNGLQLSVNYGQSEFDALLAATEKQDYDSTIGVDMNDPNTLLHGE